MNLRRLLIGALTLAAFATVALAGITQGTRGGRIVASSSSSSSSSSGGGFTPQSGFSASGTWAEDQSITITRGAGGFGTKPNDPKPLLWMPLKSSATPSSLGRVTSARPMQQFTYTSSCGADGNGCLAGSVSNGGTADNTWTVRLDSDSWGSSTYDWNSYDQKIFISRRIYKNFGDLSGVSGGTYNVKDSRLWGRSGAVDGGGDASAGLVTPSIYFSPSLGQFGFENIAQPNWDYTMEYFGDGRRAAMNNITDRWYDEEQMWLSNSAATNSGATSTANWKMAVDGGAYRFENPFITYQTNVMRLKNASGDGGDGRLRVLFIVHKVVDTGGGSRPSAPDGSYMNVDDIYVDDSWARVVIGDSATYTSCTVRRPQPPSAWSDTSVTFTIQSQGLTLSGKHVFIVTDADTVFYAGQISSLLDPSRWQFLRSLDAANDSDFSLELAA